MNNNLGDKISVNTLMEKIEKSGLFDYYPHTGRISVILEGKPKDSIDNIESFAFIDGETCLCVGTWKSGEYEYIPELVHKYLPFLDVTVDIERKIGNTLFSTTLFRFIVYRYRGLNRLIKQDERKDIKVNMLSGIAYVEGTEFTYSQENDIWTITKV